MVGFEGPFQKISALSDEHLFTVPTYIPIKVVHFLRNLIQNLVLFIIIIKLNKIQRINAIFRHIRLTLLAVIKQQELHILSVSYSLSYLARKAHGPIFICDLSDSTIFFHIIS